MPTATSPLPAEGLAIGSGTITVPQALANPTRIQREISTLAALNYWGDRVLPNGGNVEGGAVLFDVVQPGDMFAGRDAEQIPPGGEFPVVNSSEPDPVLTKVAKLGAKIEITDEKRDRNDVGYLNREQRRAANTTVRKFHTALVAAFDAAVSAYARSTPAGSDWSTIVPNGNTPTNYRLWPHADIVKAQAVADATDTGAKYDTLLAHPLDVADLAIIYNQNPNGVFAALDAGIDGKVISTNLVAQGAPLLIQSGQAGGARWEKPLSTEQWREAEIQTSYIQLDGRVAYYVDNPYAVLRLTGV